MVKRLVLSLNFQKKNETNQFVLEILHFEKKKCNNGNYYKIYSIKQCPCHHFCGFGAKLKFLISTATYILHEYKSCQRIT